ncbi:MAG: hypothetical protein RI894_1866 [Bacteroidota bacterium]|jgi:iron complex outermembrane receptor protein
MIKLLPLRFFPLTFLFLVLGFNVQAQRTITGTITSSSDKKPLPEAIVLLKGSNIATVSDEMGKFSINVPNNDGALIFTYIGFQSKELPLSAPSFDVALDEGIEMDNVVVVGTRNASRTRIESPVPVDIIPVRSVVNEVGQVDINQLLHYAAPSFNSTRQNVWDGADHIDPASLRGLGTDQVLVLINGKRRHATAFINVEGTPSRGQASTDMGSIPAYAIERIEILRDGASAQYGSDAIAGVINIVLRKDANRLTAAVTSGINAAGDGLTYAGNVDYGFKIGKKGYLNISGEYKNRGAANRAMPWSGPLYFYPDTDAGGYFSDTTHGRNEEYNYNHSIVAGRGKTAKELDDDTLKVLGRTRRDYAMQLGQSQMTSYGAMANFAMPLYEDKEKGTNVEVYAFGGVNRKQGKGAGFYRFPSDGSNVASIYKEGFLPYVTSDINDYSGAVGVRGMFSKWNFDMSNVYGQNTFKYGVENSLNASREAYSQAAPSLGLKPQTSFDCGTVGFYQNTTNIDFSHHNPNLFHGTNFAFGGEYRTDRYTQAAGEESSYRNYGLVKYVGIHGQDSIVDRFNVPGGAQVFPGFSKENTVDGSRSNFALYGDMESDFTANLMLGIALRYEKYSDFGETQNYKLVAKYKINKQFMLRGSASTGFRAPSVHQIYYHTVATSFTQQGTSYELGIYPNDSKAALALGIPKLKQETSINYSAGFAAKPNDDLEITLDGYIIDIKDRIVLTGEFNDGDTLVAKLLKNTGTERATFFTNAVDTRTTGLDLVVSYHKKFANHDFRFVLAGNWNKNEVVGDIKLSDSLKRETNLRDTYFSREDISHIEKGAPNAKVTFSINWKHKKMWAMLRNVYFGEISYNPPYTDPGYNYYTDKIETFDQVFTPKVITDLTFGYQVAKNVNVSIGASNLFNVYPDKQTHSGNNYYGSFPYSVYVQQFGFTGAYYFARIAYDLRTSKD